MFHRIIFHRITFHRMHISPNAYFTESFFTESFFTECIFHRMHVSPNAYFTESFFTESFFTECIFHRMHISPNAYFTEWYLFRIFIKKMSLVLSLGYAISKRIFSASEVFRGSNPTASEALLLHGFFSDLHKREADKINLKNYTYTVFVYVRFVLFRVFFQATYFKMHG
jgi:hypothetical protein